MSEVYIKEPATNGKAIFRTTHGDLEVEMWATECPKACRNFCQLIREGYYNDTIFHRVIRDFIIQGGDATNTGDGSESIYGEPYPDEIHPRLKFRYRGMMGVASAGKGTKTNGSQFFIVLNRTPSLDGKHTLFAKVVGQTVYNLVRMSEAEVDKKDRPLEPPRILRAELVWDPFGDLEPRRMPSPPRPVASSGQNEVHRRAPVQNKRVLSFAASDDEDEDEEAGPSAGAKGKSAHDLLADPKLLKEAAYPEQQQRQPGKRPAPGGEARAADTGGGAKRPAGAAASKAPVRAASAATRAAAASASEDEDDDEDEDEEEDGSGGEPEETDRAKASSDRRREAINRLKREIAGVGVEDEQKAAKTRRPGSALEELRAGYQPREKRVQVTGKEGKRREANAIMQTLKAFRGRITTMSASAGSDDEQEEKDEKVEKDEATKKSKKDKSKKEEGKSEKKKSKKEGKDDKEPRKKEGPEEGTFAAIWDEGDEEADDDWLTGGGLKFHVSADKAFKLDRDRARDTLEIFDPLAAKGNSEVLADARKKASDNLLPQRRKHTQKPSSRDDRDEFRDPRRR